MTTKLSTVDPLSLAAQLGGKQLPPVHQWNPEFCGDMDLRIDRNGVWFYRNSPIGRHRLVKLLSSVMRRDEDGDYYLVTPVEKLRIRVDDVPFLAVELEVEGLGDKQRLLFRTNVDEVVEANDAHPIRVTVDATSGEPSPYVMIRNSLEALLSRPVFYRLVDLAVEQSTDGEMVLGVWSCNTFFKLGPPSDGQNKS